MVRPPHPPRPNPGPRVAACRVAGALVGAAVLVSAGCALAPPDHARAQRDGPRSDHPALHVTDRDLDVRETGRRLVRTLSGQDLLRVEFSFVSYDGYLAADDRHVSTGTLFLPVDKEGRAAADGSRLVLITEYPPGASRATFPFLSEYGELPAGDLGVPSVVVDIRGPIASGLRYFTNPDDPSGGSFSGEEQFAYAMLRSYQESDDLDLLWESQAAGAWLRAFAAVSRLMSREAGQGDPRFLVVGEGRGAISAAQASAMDERVAGVVAAGWPVDWMDYHFVRWRRWERRSGYYPLEELAPTVWRDSQEVLSFLASSPVAPDPGCPTCPGAGSTWRRQFELGTLHASGRLDAALFLLESDEDAGTPIDLLARASASSAELHAPPGSVAPGATGPYRGPFATPRPARYDDLRVLRGGQSTIVRRDAAETVRAWAQHLAGFRDLPRITAEEELRDGDLVVTVHVAEGNARVTDVLLRVIDADPSDPWDFKAPQHRTDPAPLEWRDIPALYGGHDAQFSGRWTGRFPLLSGTNQAYVVTVRTRIGEAATEHSVPIRPLWNRGDPADGPARP